MSDIGLEEQDRADMQRLASGHDAALNNLMERHGTKLFHYLLRSLGETEAADLAQETFVKVYLNRDKFRPDAKFSTWLYSIATNLLRDHFRWQKRHPEVSLDAGEDEHHSLGETLTSHTASPDESMIAAETADQVRRAVQSLPEDLRTPLILSEYENLSHAEIGLVLDCTAKAVEMRLYRARTLLKKAFENVRNARA